jgi:predicted RNase H-like HicB family nuclease
MDARQSLSCWAYIARAPDVPDQWVAHCPNFDVVSQGDSPWHAFEMVREATQMVIAEDFATGRDPHNRRAPEEYWRPVHLVVDHGRRIEAETFASMRADEPRAFVVAYTCVLQRDDSEERPYPFAIDEPAVLSA